MVGGLLLIASLLVGGPGQEVAAVPPEGDRDATAQLNRTTNTGTDARFQQQVQANAAAQAAHQAALASHAAAIEAYRRALAAVEAETARLRIEQARYDRQQAEWNARFGPEAVAAQAAARAAAHRAAEARNAVAACRRNAWRAGRAVATCPD